MDKSKSAYAPGELEYREQPWGDLIYGTKAQLQSLGIAVDIAFPGEPGANKRKMTVTDPRGLRCEIEDGSFWKGEGIFIARICFFPEQELDPEYWMEFAPGVRKRFATYSDDYFGSADALVAAGIVAAGQFPGMPGMRKVTVTIFPDGSLPSGARTANYWQAQEPGAKRVTRARKGIYCVSVYICEAEHEQRREREKQRERQREARLRALPRPPRLSVADAAYLRASRAAATDGAFQRFMARATCPPTAPS